MPSKEGPPVLFLAIKRRQHASSYDSGRTVSFTDVHNIACDSGVISIYSCARTKMNPILPTARDKLLFTPGPLTTSLSVKQAMLHDAGSWHFEFHAVVREIRDKLLALARVDPAQFECVFMQGTGTFGVEAVLGSTIPPQGKLLILVNGAYGERMLQMAICLRIPTVALRSAEDHPPNPTQVEPSLASDPAITHVAMVHCETTTGILNPIESI